MFHEKLNSQKSLENKCAFLCRCAQDVNDGKEDMKYFHENLPSLMVSLFGLLDRSGGWFGAAESSKDKEAIVTLLRPDGGQFFRMLIERGQDRYCDFPVDKLPPPVYQAIKTGVYRAIPPFLQGKLKIVGNEPVTMIRLCLWEYFMFCFAYFVVSSKPIQVSSSGRSRKKQNYEAGSSPMRNLMNLMALDEPTPSSAPVVDPGEPLFERLLTKYMDFFFGNLPEPKILTMYGSPTSSSTSAPSSLSSPSSSSVSAVASSAASSTSFLSSLVGATSGADDRSSSTTANTNATTSSSRTTKVDSNIASTNIRQTYEFYEKYKALNGAEDSRMRVAFLDIVLLFWTGQNGLLLSDIDATYARAGRMGLAANSLPPRLDMVRIAERSSFMLPTKLMMSGLQIVVKYVVDEIARLGAGRDDVKLNRLAYSRVRSIGWTQIQRSLFHFMHQCFWFWPLQSVTEAKFSTLVEMWLVIIAPWKSSFYLQAVNRSVSSSGSDALKADKSDNEGDDDDNVGSSAVSASASPSSSSSSSTTSKSQANDVAFWADYVLGSIVFFTTLTSDFIVAARDFDYSSRTDRRLALKAFTALAFPGLMSFVRSAEGSLIHSSLLVSRFESKPLDAQKTQMVTSHIQSVLGGAHVDYAPLFTDRNEQAILNLATLITNTQIRDRRRILVEIPWWAFWESAPVIKPTSTPPALLASTLLKAFNFPTETIGTDGNRAKGKEGDTRPQNNFVIDNDERTRMAARGSARALAPITDAKEVRFRGDDWIRPVTEFEFRYVVWWLYSFALFVEQWTGWRPPIRILARRRVWLFVPIAIILYILLLRN